MLIKTISRAQFGMSKWLQRWLSIALIKYINSKTLKTNFQFGNGQKDAWTDNRRTCIELRLDYEAKKNNLPTWQSAAVLTFFSSFIILSDLSFSSRLAPQQRAASTTLVQRHNRRLSLGIGFLLTNSTHNSLNDVLYAMLVCCSVHKSLSPFSLQIE